MSWTRQLRPLAADDMMLDEVWAPVQWIVVAINVVGLASAPIPLGDDSVWASVVMGSVLSPMQHSTVAAVGRVDSALAPVEAW